MAILASLILYLTFVKQFTKHFPFTGRGYELHATFRNATTLKPNSPVRIAGVNVGSVISVKPEGNMAEATFTVTDEGLPIHKDATVTLRPRLFLEGNFFLDVHPGSPSAPDLSSGATIPVTQTTTAVQIDQILTSLQSDTRTRPEARPDRVRKGGQPGAHRRPGRHPGSGCPGADGRSRRSTRPSATAARRAGRPRS